MNAIETKLVQMIYPTLDIKVLTDIINATPNTELAVSLLCGLYIEPIITQQKINSKELICTVDYYDKWADNVYFTYEKIKSVGHYFPKGTKKEDVNKDNYKELKCSYSNDVVSYNVELDEMEIKRECVSLSTWEKYKDISSIKDEDIFGL